MPNPTAQERTCLETVITACQAALVTDIDPIHDPDATSGRACGECGRITDCVHRAFSRGYIKGRQDSNNRTHMRTPMLLKALEFYATRPANRPGAPDVADDDGQRARIALKTWEDLHRIDKASQCDE